MNTLIEKSWGEILKEEFENEYFKELIDFVEKEFENKPKSIYPKKEDVFKAFQLTPFDKVKVVILGQDPYHGEGQANGLSFSVPEGIKIPPSLRNIFKELQTDVNFQLSYHGDLSQWAQQGVFLLNTILTVEKGKAGSHQNKGWEKFTDEVIQKVSEQKKNVVFLLWGKYAQKKKILIDEKNHFIIETAHPSPFSARKGFLGSKPFSKTNAFLVSKGKEPINWQI